MAFIHIMVLDYNIKIKLLKAIEIFVKTRESSYNLFVKM